LDDPLGRQLLLVAILIAINAFFAAAEIAVISLNDAKVRREAEGGNAAAAKMLKLVENPAQFLSTIQIGITLAGFLASAFAADSFSDRLVNWLVRDVGWRVPEATLNTVSVILITLILSYFTLVLGELVPKRVAMARSERVARLSTGMILFFGAAFKPFVWLMSASTNAILRLFKIDPDHTGGNVSEEEIRLMVDIGEEKGAIEPEEKEMIENIFEFNNITAADVMIHRKDMVVIWADDSDQEILSKISGSGLSRFPVCGDDIDDVLGLLRTREYLLNTHNPHPKPFRELVAPVYFVPETVPADVLFRDMQSKKMHMAIVVDEYGGTSGLVTLEDLLEEIVGNIYDEFDPAGAEPIQRLSDNEWRVQGGVEIEQLAEALKIELPEDEEFDTLGGLIFSELTEIPADGTTPEIVAYGLHIKVEEMSDHRVEWARVGKLPLEDAEEAL